MQADVFDTNARGLTSLKDMHMHYCHGSCQGRLLKGGIQNTGDARKSSYSLQIDPLQMKWSTARTCWIRGRTACAILKNAA